MSIPISCSECFWEAKVPGQYAGKVVKCKECGARVPVRTPGSVKRSSSKQPSKVKSAPPGRPKKVSAPQKRSRKRKKQADEPWHSPQKLLGLVLAVLLTIGGLVVRVAVRHMARNRNANAAQAATVEEITQEAWTPFPLASVRPFPVSDFVPERGDHPVYGERESVDSDLYDAYHGVYRARDGRAHGAKLELYTLIPKGGHEPHSLPCVLVAPAGTNMLTGTTAGPGDHPEAAPYAEAGMVVVFYSIADRDMPDDPTNAQLRMGYQEFKGNMAGLIPARNALEFALHKIPEVDPDLIYSAGHSSAGTLSLLFAEHEPRLAGSIAYAVQVDVNGALGEIVAEPDVCALLPGIRDFVIRSSPKTHQDRITKPVYLFHALDDSIVPNGDARYLYDALRRRNIDVTYDTVPHGDHYFPMIEEGIPNGIRWIQRHSKR